VRSQRVRQGERENCTDNKRQDSATVAQQGACRVVAVINPDLIGDDEISN
jgi:hypothetical protein